MTVLDLAILPWTLRLQYNNINGWHVAALKVTVDFI